MPKAQTEIILVIVTEKDMFVSSDAFIIPSATHTCKQRILRAAAIRTAENFFADKIKEVDKKVSKFDLEIYIGDGVYAQVDGAFRSVYLTWPNIHA